MSGVRDVSVSAAPMSRPQVPTARLGVSTLVLGVALGCYLPFVAVALQDAGLAVSEIGLVAALGAAGYVIVVPVLGHLADVRVGRPRMLALTCLVGGPIIAVIAVGWPPAIVAILYLTGTLFVSAWMPLNDSLLINAFPDGRRYSRWRMLQSLSYAVTAAVAGLIYATTGFTAALVAVAVGGLGLAAIAPRLPMSAHRADRWTRRARAEATRSASLWPAPAMPSRSHPSCRRSSSPSCSSRSATWRATHISACG